MPKPTDCPVCNLMFGDAAPCRCPPKVALPREPYLSCQHCNMLFSTSELAKHMPTVHRDQYKYFCNICSGLFNNAERVAEHIARHSDRQPLYCVRCAMIDTQAAHRPCPKSVLSHAQERFNGLNMPGAPRKTAPRSSRALRGAHLSSQLFPSPAPLLSDLLASFSLADTPPIPAPFPSPAAAGPMCYNCQRVFPDLSTFQRHLPCTP